MIEGSKHTLYDTIMIGICPYTFVQTLCTSGVNPKEIRTLGDDVSIQFHQLQKNVPLRYGMLLMGEAIMCGGIGMRFMRTLYFLLNFTMNLKLLYNIKSIQKE